MAEASAGYDPTQATTAQAPRRAARPAGGEKQSAQAPYYLMQNVLFKLKLLDYENQLCLENNLPTFSKVHFVFAGSGGTATQFYHFAMTCQWLLGLSGIEMEKPGQFDDPNATVATLAFHAKEAGINTELAPVKLKQGHGDIVLAILDGLCDVALKKSNVRFGRPSFPPESEDEAEIEETADDDDGDDIDDLVEAQSEGEESDIDRAVEDENHVTVAVLKSSADPAQWAMELERVRPYLKVRQVADSKEWRTHFSQMNEYEETVAGSMGDVFVELKKIASEISQATEKVTARERYVNQQFESQAIEYRTVQENLEQTSETYGTASEEVTKLTNELSRISDELGEIKGVMDDRGSSMTDSSPVVKIKKAIQFLKSEIKDLDLRIGVLENTLKRAQQRTKLSLQIGEQEQHKDRMKVFLGDDADVAPDF